MRTLGATSALFLMRIEPNFVPFLRQIVLSRLNLLVIHCSIADCNAYHTQRICCKVKPLILLHRFLMGIC